LFFAPTLWNKLPLDIYTTSTLLKPWFFLMLCWLAGLGLESATSRSFKLAYYPRISQLRQHEIVPTLPSILNDDLIISLGIHYTITANVMPRERTQISTKLSFNVFFTFRNSYPILNGHMILETFVKAQVVIFK
jgi:hypothetical protein